jgi:site-specific recombinase XerD
MRRTSVRALARDIARFLMYKRALGHPYERGAYTLRSFCRFAATQAERGQVDLPTVLRAWLARVPNRKPVSLTVDLGVLRQFCLFRRRRDPAAFVPDRSWAPQSTESHFLPCVLSVEQVRQVVRLTTTVRHPIRAATLRTMLLVLYCTGLRPGEVVRLMRADLDLTDRTLHIRESKGKTRMVPFRDDLAGELQTYLRMRATVSAATDSGPLFVRPDGTAVPAGVASDAIRRLFRKAGLKPMAGRVGPRPYDFRHTFAVHRLTAWYDAHVDIAGQLSWLSTYMGHDDLLGTEAYLTATPKLMAVAAHLFQHHYRGVQR